MFQQFYDAGAEGYDKLFGRVPQHFAGSLLRAAQLTRGQRVLDLATGTGLVAEAIVTAIGPSGQLTGVDISGAMLACAERRLSNYPQVTLEVGDAEALRFENGQFETVICSLALMLFPDPAQSAAEMHRVLKPGGRVAVSVETTAERSLTTRINTAISRYVPSRAKAASTYYRLGQEARLRPVLERAGFSDIEVTIESHGFPFPSFEAYFRPIEDGAGSVGAEFVALPQDLRRKVKEDIRRELDPHVTGGPITEEVAILFAAGRCAFPTRA